MAPSDGWRYLLLGVWQRFDTLWYLNIAANGYDRPAATVFYPLYPILIRYLSWITRDPTAAALLVSTVACFFALWGIQKLAALDDPLSSRRALVLVALWPTAFVFLAAYPDSLVTALVIWSVYAARKDRWWLAGLLAALAGLTKAVGLAACVPLAVILVERRDWKALPALALAPAGFLGFTAWLRFSGFPATATVYSTYWRTRVSWPWETLAHSFREWYRTDFDWPIGINLVSLLFFIAILLFARRKSTDYQLYSLAALILFLSKESVPILQSTSRYLLLVFPVFLYWSRTMKRPVTYILVLVPMFLMYIVVLRFFLNWGLIV
jgi:hypothetical protein